MITSTMMKKCLISMICMVSPLLCSAQDQEVNPFPWDFPQDIVIEAEPGQWVLSCYTFYPKALKNNKKVEDEILIFYSTKMTEVGQTKSKVNVDVEMPNALIIPLDKDAKAKRGDIVLTWWQGGSGLQRAIITDASNPAEPKADFLDLNYDEEKPNLNFAGKFADTPLKPGSFTVLEDGKWMSGAQVAVRQGRRWLCGTLIHERDGRVLVLGFSDKVSAYKKEDCRLIPFMEKIKKGDDVWAEWVGTYRSGYKVKKVDMNIGRVWVEKDGKVEVKSLADVTKVLE